MIVARLRLAPVGETMLGLLAFEWVKHARPAPGRTTSRRKLQRFSRIETLRSMAFRLLHELYRLRCIAQSMLRRLAKRDRGPRATAATHTNRRSANFFHTHWSLWRVALAVIKPVRPRWPAEPDWHRFIAVISESHVIGSRYRGV